MTDYYEQWGFCDHCGRVDRLHMGRLEEGKRFVFAAHSALRVGQRSDWRRRLGRAGRIIVDDKGREVPQRIFWPMVEASQHGPIHRVTSDGKRWIDSLGYSIQKFD